MAAPDVFRLLELQRLLLSFSQVERRIERRHGDSYVRENDTEHSYNLAMTAWFLVQSFPKLDPLKVVTGALVHDLVEVYAGDTFLYGNQAELDSKAAREKAALERLADEWSDFPQMIHAIHMYESRDSAEARFVYALDKVMPILIIYIHNGYTWHKEGITLAMLEEAKREKVSLSPEILPYFEEICALLAQSPDVIADR